MMMRWALLLLTFGFGCAAASVPIDSGGSTRGGTTTNGTTMNGTSGGGATGGSGGSGPPVPDGPWINSTANLGNLDTICGGLRWLSAKPDQDMLIAGIAQEGMWASTDGGASWQPLGTGAGSAMITNRISSLVYDPIDPARYWQSGIYEGHGVYETKDNGSTFEQLGDIVHVDLVSVDFSDPERKFLLAGGHEQARKLRKSVDGGMTWTDVGDLLPDDHSACNAPLILDTMTALAGCGAPFAGGGILRSTDGAMTWTLVSKTAGAVTPLRASNGMIYWPAPVGQVLVRSADDGETWTDSTGDAGFFTPVELPDGRILSLGGHYVVITADHATTWQKVVMLPYDGVAGIAYSVHRKAIYVWRSDCGPQHIPVSTDAVMRYDFE